MKILHVSADHKWTGPAEPMLNAVLGLRARGESVDLVCPEPPPESGPGLLGYARERGVEPVALLRRERGLRPLRDRAEVLRLRELIRDGGYDVVHTHHTRDHLLCRWALRGAAARLVVSWHRGDPIPTTPWSRLRLGPRGTTGLVVLSPGVGEHACRALGWPERRVAVVPGVVDTERFRPRAPSERLREEFGITSAQRVIGVVARLQPHRRMDLLLAAFARALGRAPGLRLVVVGRGTRAREVLHEPLVRLGLEKVAVAAGYRAQDYVDVLSTFDALTFLVPGSDGSCRALLEAMSMGIPAITSQRGLLPEIVRDRETGRVLPEDETALAGAFEELWSEPARWRSYGEAARAYVARHHTFEHAAERLERFYTELLSS
ncbi:MAG: glycosyltransferase family 4 protein [Deltaproteobacteria bacterium]|nr:glycosyltransferase family 4 protein [Deltaproteobacteria bacterium]